MSTLHSLWCTLADHSDTTVSNSLYSEPSYDLSFDGSTVETVNRSEGVKCATKLPDNFYEDDNNYSKVYDGYVFNPEISSNIIKPHLLSLISNVLSLGVPYSTISVIVENFKDIISSMFKEIDCHFERHKTWVFFFCTRILSSFNDHLSVYKLKKHFSKNIPQPKEIALGVRYDQVLNRQSNVCSKKCNQYIHIYTNFKNTFLHFEKQVAAAIFLY